MADIETTIGVLIIEDHDMVAAALGAALDREVDIAVVGIVDSVPDAVDVLGGGEVDVVLLDLGLAGVADASTHVSELREASPIETRFVALTGAADHRSITAAMANGCDGYLVKHQPIAELSTGVRDAADGRMPLPAGYDPTTDVGRDPATEAARSLSARELEVLALLAEGVSTREIAERLFLSVNTVRNHIQSAMERLGVHSRLEAVAVARRLGVIPS